MLNLTRQERLVIKFLVIFYLISCVIYFVKNNFLTDIETIQYVNDSIAHDFSQRVEVTDSLFNNSKNIKDIVNKKVNINKAGIKEFELIKGVGPVTARRIYEYRDKNGQFNNIEELKNIKGIGEKTFIKIKNEVTIE